MHEAIVRQKIAERLLFPSSIFCVIGNTDQDGEAGSAQPSTSLQLLAPECLRMLQSKIAEQRRFPTPWVSKDDQMSMEMDRLSQCQNAIRQALRSTWV